MRVKFADPAETWVTSIRTRASPRHDPPAQRVERWLYNGLHSLDFPSGTTAGRVGHRVIVLCLGGVHDDVLGLAMGIKRMRRGARPPPCSRWFGADDDAVATGRPTAARTMLQ